MTAPALRRATIEDAAGIVALLNTAYRGEASRLGWTTEADFLDGQRTDRREIDAVLDDPSSVMLVLGTGAVAGSVQVRADGVKAYVGMLAVAPHLQARGYGRLLLEGAEQLARETFGARTVCMWVLSLRQELIAWYLRRGYQVQAQRLPFPHTDERFGRPKRPDLEFCLLMKELLPG